MKKLMTTFMTVILLVTSNASIAMADTLPPISISQDELANLKAMSLDDLRAVAKPMPKEILNRKGNDVLDSNNFPRDKSIYSIIYMSSDGSVEETYYRFLYVSIGPSKNMVTYHIYEWTWYKDEWWLNQEITCDNYNSELYAQLLKLDNDTNSGNTGIVSIQRIKGNTKIETAAAIANKFSSETVQAVIVVTGNNFPDALAGSAYAAKLGAPIILVDADVIKQKEYIDSTNYTKEIFFGGTGAISISIEETLSKQSR